MITARRSRRRRIKWVNSKGRTNAKARRIGGWGEGDMGVIFQPFSVYSTSSTHYNSQVSLCTIISKLLIFNVTGQSQILLLHLLLTALTIPQSLILLASLLFSLSPSLFISTPFFLCRPSFSLTHTHIHKNTFFLSYPLCPSLSPP